MHSDFSKGIESEEFIELLDENEQKLGMRLLFMCPPQVTVSFPFT